jgi:hypothetical protein
MSLVDNCQVSEEDQHIQEKFEERKKPKEKKQIHFYQFIGKLTGSLHLQEYNLPNSHLFGLSGDFRWIFHKPHEFWWIFHKPHELPLSTHLHELGVKVPVVSPTLLQS